jgi:peptide/nickel transport system permease protein
MFSFLLKRIIYLIPVMVGVSVIVFSLVRLIPGDVVDIMLSADVGGTYDGGEEMRAYFGLDQPAHVQYQKWISKVLRGDLGVSFTTGRPVAAEIIRRIPITLQMISLSIFVAVGVGIPIGIISALRRNSFLDNILRFGSIGGLSIPSFWLATMVLLTMSTFLPQFRILGYVSPLEDPVANLQRMLLPCLILGFASGAGVMRMTRTAMLEVLNEEYVRTARSKGLSERIVIYRHALPNAMIPITTLLGIQIGVLIGGSIILEEVFAIPGMGRLVLNAIRVRDYPIIQGVTLMIAIMFAMINLMTDLFYGYLNPRVKAV